MKDEDITNEQVGAWVITVCIRWVAIVFILTTGSPDLIDATAHLLMSV